MFPAIINVQMNDELNSLYEADKQERIDQPRVNTAEYKAMRARDLTRREHELALLSSQLGNRRARWLATASYDRWQMVKGKPQKDGTNYVYDGHADRLWDVDPSTTDEERAEWDVPPLAEQLRKVQEANRHKTPLSQNELRKFEANAPEWLQQALKRWRAAENRIE